MACVQVSMKWRRSLDAWGTRWKIFQRRVSGSRSRMLRPSRGGWLGWEVLVLSRTEGRRTSVLMICGVLAILRLSAGQGMQGRARGCKRNAANAVNQGSARSG